MSLLDGKSAANAGKAMGSNDHTASNAAYMQMSSRPDRDGWVVFLRDRLPFSFGKIKREKHLFLLDDPISPPAKGADTLYAGFNFWYRALAYYSGGKIADVSALDEVLKDYRQMLIQSTVDKLRNLQHEMFIYSARDHIWNSEQLHRLLLLLDRNRLERERASTTLIVQSLEFIIKAMCVHCNFYLEGSFFFEGHHKLYKLFKSLPEDCQKEVNAESVYFWNQYQRDRESAEALTGHIVEQLVHPKRVRPIEDDSVASGLSKIRDAVARKKYLDVFTTGSETTVGGASKQGPWLEKALRCAGELTNHRYGPVPRSGQGWVPATDLYSTDAIAHAQLAARFFLEHLFGTADLRSHPWQYGV